MPRISNTKRRFSICGKSYTIPDTISFKNNCIVEFNQNQADTLYKHILNVIEILDNFCSGEYWAIGGTLLGTIRWQTILPWDDDLDFAVTTKGYSLLVDNIYKINNHYGYEFLEYLGGIVVYHDNVFVGDIFVCDYLDNKHLVYSGPVIDGVSTFHVHKYLLNQIKFKDTDVFPLIRKPFGNKTIPCPKKYTKILHNNYTKGVLETIILPKINNLHLSISKEIYTELQLYYTRNYYKDNPETFILFSSIFRYIVNYNMKDFTKSKDLLNVNINYPNLLKEQLKPEIIYNQIKFMSVLIPSLYSFLSNKDYKI